MVFERFDPTPELSHIIREFWVYENPKQTPEVQKVIPDGFSEIIIHYGDPYRINLEGAWEQQSRLLFSNQISKYFQLENSGASAMIGMKLFPTAGYELFGTDMSTLTDRVIPLEQVADDIPSPSGLTSPEFSTEMRIAQLEDWVAKMTGDSDKDTTKIRHAIDQVFTSNGMYDIQQLADSLEISLRQFERLFKKSTGVTFKFFSRIVRFNHIFQLMKDEKLSWIQIALQSGYFDQSHFIKNFKEFTGEEPSSYGFDDKTLANFFLKK
ncbi:MAG: helix-turn-helix transcriptional regulator [Cyclobacteriaceae bacterium]